MANQTCSKKPLKPYAPPFYPSRFNHHHASRTNCTNKWFVHFPVATGPRNCVVPNRKPKDKPRFNEGAKRLFIKKQHHREIWKSHVCITRKSWPLFKSKKIAQVVRAWIQSKNTLVKHFEDMRLCRPSKEYLQVKLVSMVDDERRSRPNLSLRRSHSTRQNGCSVLSKHNMIAYLEKTEGNVEFHEVIDFLRRSYIYHALTQQPDPSPRPSPRPSPTPIVPDSIPEPTGENLGDHSSNDTSLLGNEDDMTLPNVYDLCISLCKQVSDQAKEIKLLKAQITKLKKQAKPECIQLIRRKIAKGESSVQRDPLFDVMPEDNIDHMETDNAQSEGRTREMVDEDKEIDEVRLSTEDAVSTDRPIVSTDGSKVSTDEQIEGTDEQVEGSEEHNEGTEEIFESSEEHNEGTEEIFESTEEQRESTEEKVESTAGQIKGTEDQTKEEIATQASQTSTQTPTSMIIGDDETIATLLLNMSQAKAASKEKEKGVELKDVEEIDRPRPTSTRSLLTLKPLPKIDPKDKGKKKIEEEDESESEDDDIPQAVKKFKQLESDEEMARKIQEEWEAEEERNKIAEEKATNEALIKNFDDIKARIEADRILAEKLQE
ncbi:hypothetical protein Tco_0613711 [Tanacetum coccineum]